MQAQSCEGQAIFAEVEMGILQTWQHRTPAKINSHGTGSEGAQVCVAAHGGYASMLHKDRLGARSCWIHRAHSAIVE